MQVANGSYHLKSNGNYTSLKDQAGFLREIYRDPKKYIMPQPEMVATL